MNVPAVRPDAGRSHLALLVDRDDDTRSMYSSYLQLASFEIEEASDGREALAKALGHRPDLVVTETRLAGIDGFELCRLLRDDVATRTMPIVVVTGDAMPSDVARARLAGADQVLVKPCLPDVLLREIKRLLEASHELRERSIAARTRAENQLARSNALLAEAVAKRRSTLSRSHLRGRTTTPSLEPPPLHCPRCDQLLAYEYSHVGGVSIRHPEQWDYYTCPSACGTFQYRHRTRKLRKI